jgi:PDZ domain
MTTPKHLWTGDWEQESADAAAARGSRRVPALPAQQAPEPPPEKRRRRTWSVPKVRLRLVLIGLAAVLVLAGGAYGLTRLGESSRSPATGAPWLGATLGVWGNGGALVATISKRGPAAAAGLQPGDVIRFVQGRPVGAPVNVNEAVAALRVGDRLRIQFERASKLYETTVVLAPHPPGVP